MTAKKTGYDVVTEKILSLLDRGVVPWRAGHNCGSTGPGHNGATNHEYHGINAMMTWAVAMDAGYESTEWFTFAQLREMGESVIKGEKATPILYFNIRKDDDDKVTGAWCRWYSVFNRQQTTLGPAEGVAERFDHDPIEACEAIAAGFTHPTGPQVKHGALQPCYSPTADVVKMPNRDRYETAEEYYSTLFHELAHSTGHASRLDREMPAYSVDRKGYAAEELVAEITAAFLCHAAGIAQPVIENQAAYLASWRKAISDDPKLIVQAASKAQKAADLILSRSPVLATADNA